MKISYIKEFAGFSQTTLESYNGSLVANYLNSIKPFSLFESEQAKPYFVDKSFMITELLSLIQSGSSYVCITRPRRFGKTLMASMIAAYLEKNRNSADVFNCLKISESESYREHLNAHDVIYIAFNELSTGILSLTKIRRPM